ncbi:MAG: response regulator [Clostridium sp.]
MKNVMIIDDEKLIRDGLKVLIDWESLGLFVKEEASNGVEALEKLKGNDIQVIVSDINMPNMTGLEFIEKLREINKDIKIVILSGYDHFSYAKKAICHGVSDYLLKPIDEEELYEVLKNIVLDIEKNEKKKNLYINKDKNVLEILKGNIKDLSNLRNSINIDEKGKSYVVASVILSKERKVVGSVDLNKIFKREKIDKYEILDMTEKKFLIIKEWMYEVEMENVLKNAYKLKEFCNEEFGGEAFIGVGCVVNSIDKINESYKEAIEINKYILTEGTNICLCKENLKYLDSSIKTFELDFQKINKKIIEKNFEESKVLISELFKRNDLTPKDIYDFSIGILFMLYKISEEFKIEGKGYDRENLSSTMVELCSESTTESIENFLIREVQNVISNMYVGTAKYSPVVQQIVSYVNDKYYEELSLKVLSNKYNINSSYLGQLFIKEVGMSFSDYLNGVKNEKAKELLLETNMKINDIAKKVGFVDTSYFYRKFKKYYGVSPSVLRDLKNY